MENRNNYYIHVRLIQLANMVMAGSVDQDVLEKVNESLNNVKGLNSLDAIETSVNSDQSSDDFVTPDQLAAIRERKVKQREERDARAAEQEASEKEVETEELEEPTPRRTRAKPKAEVVAE